jgi:hypothetical protein
MKPDASKPLVRTITDYIYRSMTSFPSDRLGSSGRVADSTRPLLFDGLQRLRNQETTLGMYFASFY